MTGPPEPDRGVETAAPAATSRRSARPWWLAAGLVVVALVMLREIDARLGRLRGGLGESFDSSAFTDPRWPPNDATRLFDAISAWTTDVAAARLAGRSVVQHACVDLVLFTPAYLVLAWYALRWLLPPAWSRATWARVVVLGLPLALLVVEVAEGAATLVILQPWNWGEHEIEAGGLLWIIPVLSTLKWALLFMIFVVVTAFAYIRTVDWLASRRQN